MSILRLVLFLKSLFAQFFNSMGLLGGRGARFSARNRGEVRDKNKIDEHPAVHHERERKKNNHAQALDLSLFTRFTSLSIDGGKKQERYLQYAHYQYF